VKVQAPLALVVLMVVLTAHSQWPEGSYLWSAMVFAGGRVRVDLIIMMPERVKSWLAVR